MGEAKSRTESVRRAADERIRREALRQLERIKPDSDDWRFEQIPAVAAAEKAQSSSGGCESL